MLVHNMYNALRGEVSPVVQWIDGFLMQDRDPQQSQGENDVVADDRMCDRLAQLVGINSHEARCALVSVNGDMQRALVNELERIRYNQTVLLGWCRSYLTFRRLGQEEEDEQHAVKVDEKEVETRRQWKQCCRLRDRMQSYNDTGMAGIIQTILEMDPAFADHHPGLFFSLQRIHVGECIRTGKYTQAMDIVRRHMAALSLKYPETLAEPLKEAAMMLLYPQSPPSPLRQDRLRTSSAQDLSAPVFIAVSKHLGMEEPILQRLVRHLLQTHTSWCQLQCQDDEFEEVLGIKGLKRQVDVGVSEQEGVQQSPSASEQRFFDAEAQESAERNAMEAGLSDDDVRLVMELLSCTRVEAIGFLLQFDGDASRAIGALFG